MTDAPAAPEQEVATPFVQLGGSVIVAEIVDRFYALMNDDPSYAPLRALHADDLTPVREGLTGFLTGWLGGPRDWFDRGKCVMSAHGGMTIDASLTEQWCEAMTRAIAMQPGVDPTLAKRMTHALTDMAEAIGRARAAA